MALKFDRISGDDAIFRNPEYIADSIIFKAFPIIIDFILSIFIRHFIL